MKGNYVKIEDIIRVFDHSVNLTGLKKSDLFSAIMMYYTEIGIFERMLNGSIKIHEEPLFKISTLAIAKNAKYSLN